ncbi:MAG: hypothetical protein RLW61_18845 [Gammaproteobacteria bacterium]
MDLFAWLDRRGRVVRFQLTCTIGANERTVAWAVDEGLRHFAVDDSVAAGRHPGSPLLVAGEMLDLAALRQDFLAAAGHIEPGIREQVVACLRGDHDADGAASSVVDGPLPPRAGAGRALAGILLAFAALAVILVLLAQRTPG